MFAGDTTLGLFSDDEDGFLESIVFGDYNEEDNEEEEIETVQRRIVVTAGDRRPTKTGRIRPKKPSIRVPQSRIRPPG